MKKLLFKILFLSLFITNAFATGSGCLSLANSQWTGDFTLINNSKVSISVNIASVTPLNQKYSLSGTLNGAPLIKSMCGATPDNPNQILVELLAENSQSIIFTIISPTVDNINNPQTMENIFGNITGAGGGPFSNATLQRS